MIELKHLTKKYDHFLAVSDLNLKIETGEFFGLLGPNGAGRMLSSGSACLWPIAVINVSLISDINIGFEQNAVTPAALASTSISDQS